MTLNKRLGSILDRAISNHPVCSTFAKLKVHGQDLRSYFHETNVAQCQILFYRDKWWTQDGGTLHGELLCLVPKVQLALCGRNQSLGSPDYAIPFHHFQFGLLESNPEQSWQIRSNEDVLKFEVAVSSWLSSTATGWFGQFKSDEGVIEFMKRNERFLDLAFLYRAMGLPDQSRRHLIAWISRLPRQIDKSLDRLLYAGLLSPAEHSALSSASLQREDRYRDVVSAWITNARASLRSDGSPTTLIEEAQSVSPLSPSP